MPLRFRVEVCLKSEPRIAVIRVPEKTSTSGKQVGTFNSKRGRDQIRALLTPDELYEYENFLAVLDFSSNYFGKSANELDRIMLKAAPEFLGNLVKIWEEARQYNIEFLPEREMLYALLNRAITVEQQLALLTDNKFAAFGTIGFDLNKSLHPKAVNTDYLLFKALLAKLSSIELAELLNKIIKSYGKRTAIKSELLAGYAEPNNLHVAKWYYAIAIEAMLNIGLNPTDYLSAPSVTEHWLRLNKTKTLAETIKRFKQKMPALAKESICHKIIERAFIFDELRTAGNIGETVKEPNPIHALEKWLNQWKLTNKSGTKIDAIDAFKKSFSLIGQNKFCLSWIEQQNF